ncbi:MAG: radical SAM protein [Leptospiraceae bacterium]|nr:radical SAM protein [Leptospiraceae bacterium]
MQNMSRADYGRGALSSPEGRFEQIHREREQPQDPPAHTIYIGEVAKSILTRNDSPDVPFDISLNAYRGCEHGCIYCYARPSHAYLDLSPGRDFESQIFVKRNAVDLLRKAFQKPSYKVSPIVLGANTDPYQPAERTERLTRGILELCEEYRHPVAITTKSHLIVRDLDILAALAKQSLVSVNLSITSLQPDLLMKLEPRAGSSARRLAALRKLRENGVPAGVLMAPVIPGLNDTEIEHIVRITADQGALWLYHILLRLPYEVKDLFAEWLERYFPEKKDRILHLVQSTRSGKMNDARFGHRMTGSGNYAQLIQMRVRAAVQRSGIPGKEVRLRRDLFSRAPGGQPYLFTSDRP